MEHLPTLTLVRHGETEWSKTHRHTGRTDLELTPAGAVQAAAVAAALAGSNPLMVLASPLRRAADTCAIAGFGARMQVEPDLMEWDYGAYEGLTSAAIREQRPDWSLFRDGCPDGESPVQVARRADHVIWRARAADGDVLVFSHGHLTRVLAARWLGLDPACGRFLTLDTAAICVLGYEHGPDEPAILRWNDTHHLRR